MKKFFTIGLIALGFSSLQARAVVPEDVVAAFEASTAVRDATRELRQELRGQLPGCTINVETDLGGDMVFARNVKKLNIQRIRREHLVLRYVSCTLVTNNARKALRATVAAKVTTRHIKLADGSVDVKNPRVVMVDLNSELGDDDSDEDFDF